MNEPDLAAMKLEQSKSIVPSGWTPPTVLPASWVMQQSADDGAKYINYSMNLAAILSCRYEADGRAWLHLSVSHRLRIPTWGEFRHVKELFLGDREAYTVLPPKARYVNIHPHVLHAFALLSGEALLPDFTSGTGSL